MMSVTAQTRNANNQAAKVTSPGGVLRSPADRFWRSENGNVAMLVAFASVPLCGAMGLALDYSRVSLGRAELQAAVDSAGLAVARMPKETSVATLQTKAQEWVASTIHDKGLGKVTVTVTREETTLNVRAETTVSTTLFGVIQQKPTAIAASRVILSSLSDL